MTDGALVYSNGGGWEGGESIFHPNTAKYDTYYIESIPHPSMCCIGQRTCLKSGSIPMAPRPGAMT